jgi:hypothetical protein
MMRSSARLSCGAAAVLAAVVGCGSDDGVGTGAGGAGATGGTAAGGAGATTSVGGSGTVDWLVQFGDTEDDEGEAVAADADGNTFVIASYRGAIDFAGTSFASAGSSDILVASLDASGAPRWGTSFGGGLQDLGVDIALGPGGDIWIAAQFLGTVTFGATELTAVGTTDTVVARLDPAGEVVWARAFGGPVVDKPVGIAVDDSGNAWVTGSFTNEIDVGGVMLTDADGAGSYVARLDPNGDVLGAWSLGSEGGHSVRGVAVDATSGLAYVVGYAATAVDFGLGPISIAGGTDAYVVAVDVTGAPQWSQSFGGPEDDFGLDITAANGEVAITGSFRETIDFGGGALSAGSAIFVASLDASGAHRWSSLFEHNGVHLGEGIAIGADGNTYVAGRAAGDAIVAGFDGAGVELWSEELLEGSALSIAAADGFVVVTGQLDGPDSAGGDDGFVLRLTP